MKAHISSIASYFPERKLSNHDVIQLLDPCPEEIDPAMIDALIGPCHRFYAAQNEQASDLAVGAANKLLDRQNKHDVDLLIYASACGDLIEPATANIVQQKLGIACASYDVKNACNSVASAIEIASSMIVSGAKQKVLICSGEKPSDSIKFHGLTRENIFNHFASFSFGDAGVALTVEASEDDETGLFYQKNKSFGEFWPLCQVAGGGSLHPKDASKLYFSGDTYNLKKVLSELGPPFVKDCLSEAGVKTEEIKLICSHQVSKTTASNIAQQLDYPVEQIVQTFEYFGNTASTSMPIAFEFAINGGRLDKGDLVLLLGMVAGINISVQLMRY